MFAAIIIITLLILILILLIVQKPTVSQEPTVYVIGREEWPASYWNWYGGYGGWGSRPHHRLIAGPGYKPAGNYGPRYGDKIHYGHH